MRRIKRATINTQTLGLEVDLNPSHKLLNFHEHINLFAALCEMCEGEKVNRELL
jgi:hypothetical protein